MAVQGHAALLKPLLARLAEEKAKRGSGDPEGVQAEIEDWKGACACGVVGVGGVVGTDERS